MEVTEKDREMARKWLVETRVALGMFDSEAQRVASLVPSMAALLATARAEGRRAGMLEAAALCDDTARPLRATLGDKDNPLDDMPPALHAVRGAADTSEYLAAAIRAAAGEGGTP